MVVLFSSYGVLLSLRRISTSTTRIFSSRLVKESLVYSYSIENESMLGFELRVLSHEEHATVTLNVVSFI